MEKDALIINYLKEKIINLIEKKIYLMTKAIIINNRWFENHMKKCLEKNNIDMKDIEKYIQDYEKIFFKIKSIERELKFNHKELETLLPNKEYENFKWVETQKYEREFLIKFLTKSDFDIDN